MKRNQNYFFHLDNANQIIEKLIEKGANVNHVDIMGRTPLQRVKGKIRPFPV